MGVPCALPRQAGRRTHPVACGRSFGRVNAGDSTAPRGGSQSARPAREAAAVGRSDNGEFPARSIARPAVRPAISLMIPGFIRSLLSAGRDPATSIAVGQSVCSRPESARSGGNGESVPKSAEYGRRSFRGMESRINGRLLRCRGDCGFRGAGASRRRSSSSPKGARTCTRRLRGLLPPDSGW